MADTLEWECQWQAIVGPEQSSERFGRRHTYVVLCVGLLLEAMGMDDIISKKRG